MTLQSNPFNFLNQEKNPMTRRINLLTLLAAFIFTDVAIAQPKGWTDPTSDEVVKENYEIKGQHKEWKAGNYRFPSKPKDMWEIGIHGGLLGVYGDVNARLGYGGGLHIRKSFGYTFSARLNALVGQANNMNYNPSFRGVELNSNLNSAAAIKANAADGVTVSDNLAGGYGQSKPYYYSTRANMYELSLQGIITLNNLKFHKYRNKWDLFLIAGAGANYYQLKYDALDANGNLYDFSSVTGDANSRKGRKDIYNGLKNVFDKKYDVKGEEWGQLFNAAGKDTDGKGVGGRLNGIFNAGLGIGYKISKRMSITLEHQATFADDDLMDGYRWAEQGDFTRDVDVMQYTSLRLNFHLGSAKKRLEPLWWVNPLNGPLQDIADLKKEKGKVQELLADDDGDGVINPIDQEPDTEKDCPVNTLGVALDSDNDGIIDCKDKEPYSPPGVPVDPNGVAQVKPYLTKEDADKTYLPQNDPRLGTLGNIHNNPNDWRNNGNPGPVAGLDEWFLPMIHFDLDKFRIKPQFYEQCHYVANVMKSHPSISVVAKGHTDVRMPNDYNLALAYKRANRAIEHIVQNYGIDRGRFVLQYGGENEPLIPSLPDNHTRPELEYSQYLNRRVEFRVAKAGDTNMNAPSVPNFERIGADSPQSSRPGRIYSGNPGSGY